MKNLHQIALISAALLCLCPSLLAAETVGYSLSGSKSVYLKTVKSYDDCADLRDQLYQDVRRLHAQVSECMASSEIEIVSGVTICGKKTITAYPNCISLSNNACSRADYAREKLRQCYSILQRQLKEGYRRTALEADRLHSILEEPSPGNVGERASIMADTLNQVRPNQTPAQQLSNRLTGLSLHALSNRAQSTLDEFDFTVDDLKGDFSTENPIPSSQSLQPPAEYAELHELAETVAEKEYRLPFLDGFSSEPDRKELLPEWTELTSLGRLEADEPFSVPELIRMLQTIPEEDRTRRVEEATSHRNASPDVTSLASAFANRLRDLERANGVGQAGAPRTARSNSGGGSSLMFSTFPSCDRARALFDAGRLSGTKSHLTFMSDAHWDCCALAKEGEGQAYQGGAPHFGLLWAYEVLCGSQPAQRCILGRKEQLCPYRPIGPVPPFPH